MDTNKINTEALEKLKHVKETGLDPEELLSVNVSFSVDTLTKLDQTHKDLGDFGTKSDVLDLAIHLLYAMVDARKKGGETRIGVTDQNGQVIWNVIDLPVVFEGIPPNNVKAESTVIVPNEEGKDS